LFAIPLALALGACNNSTPSSPVSAGGKTSNGAAPAGGLKDLKVEDVKPGSGTAAQAGDTVYVKYKGALASGEVFDQTAEGGRPFKVDLGAGQVIPGWEKGLIGVKKGTVRKISIPYALAYGEAGSAPKIPARADLFFDIEVLEVIPRSEARTISADDLKVGQGATVDVGSKVTIEYRGLNILGQEFESTETIKKPVTFTVGADEAIEAIDMGIRGMRAGGKRRLTVPPALATGINNPKVPPGEPVTYEIDVVSVK